MLPRVPLAALLLAGALRLGARSAALGAEEAPSPAAPGDAGMVLVPAGPFTMGTARGEPDAAPPHVRELPAFRIDRLEVSVGEYARFVAETGHAPPVGWGGAAPPAGQERMPVTDVTWLDAMEYAVWAGKRLPTEAEWEKAARGTDGRLYPWGPADDPARRNIDSGKLQPVGSRPEGASPFGVQDLSGNAWEWTADWYDAYPSSAARSVQFGREHKVFRGGAAEYYYGLANAGTATQRARCVPYGSHDFVGFRCAKSARPEDEPYDPAKAIDEARKRLESSLREPVPLSHDSDLERMTAERRVPVAVRGRAGRRGLVRLGVPFPRGALGSVESLRLETGAGEPRPLQAAALTTWDDGSVRWALAEFEAAAGDAGALAWDGGPRAEPSDPLRVSGTGALRSVESRSWRTTVGGESLLRIERPTAEPGGRPNAPVVGALAIELEVEAGPEGARTTHVAMEPEAVEVEEAGPLHAVVRLRGAMAPPGGPSGPFRFDLRVGVERAAPRVSVLATVTCLAPRESTWRVREAMVSVRSEGRGGRAVCGTDRGSIPIEGPGPIVVAQPDDLRYEVLRGAEKVAGGTRAPGWLACGSEPGWLALGVRHFWQNHPKALFRDGSSLGAKLWTGAEPLVWEGGLAKTHELVLEWTREEPATMDLEPLRASLPPEWACGPAAIGAPLLPRGKEAIERFPYWELVHDACMRKWHRAMPTGFRHFGDGYMGGPYKGKNAYADLEYDVHFNFFLEHLRTGDPWYLDAAEPMARHQADIDTNHATGQPWKHSPDHTETAAELGHVFVRGLILHWLLTGERRSLDVAREIGDWIAGELQAFRGVGNERQIGWSLYALTALHDATRDPRYLKAAAGLCDRLVRGQDARGKFAIRWDNRIAFFNGIAASGMLEVAERTGDARIAEGVMRIARRTLGMYPEYACRTLHLYAWAGARTGDPRCLDMLERTWELSMEFLLPRDASTEETLAWRFRDFAARRGLFPLFEGKTPALPVAASWRAVRLGSPRAEAWLEPASGEPAAVLVVREGLSPGRVEVLDAGGRTLESRDLQDGARIFEPAALVLPSGPAPVRVRLSGDEATRWQLHHDARSRLAICDRTGSVAPDLFPGAFCFLAPGAKEVEVRLEASGEGFHTATLLDPAGSPVATARRFVDFEDPGRYEFELKAAAGGDRKGWNLEVHHAKVLAVEGLLPWWSASPDQLFDPEARGLGGPGS